MSILVTNYVYTDQLDTAKLFFIRTYTYMIYTEVQLSPCRSLEH